jgi:signal transduction histidine kinase
VIDNLVSNALKYSPADKSIWIDLSRDDARMVLRVQDEGIGIPDEDLKHLFEPFHRASNVGTISGTGLGLSITKHAVDLHGGTIVPESQPGVGTTFTVTLPVRAASS